RYRDGIDNLLVLLIGGIPIAMPTVLSVTMAIGSHRLSQQGAITKRMTAIEEMAGMDVLCSDKTGTLTLNKLTVDKNLIEARAGIIEVHFLPFNPVDKRTAITYYDSNGNWHRCSKGAPEQIIELCGLKGETLKRAHEIIDNFANRGLRSLGVARQLATIIAVYAHWEFARIRGIGWGWGGVIWIYSIVTYVPLDIIKFGIRFALSGKAWDSMIQNRTAFTTKKDYGKGEREAQWAMAQRTLHGLSTTETAGNENSYKELSEIAEQAKRRAEVARLRELHTLKGHVESVVKLKGLDIETIQQHYTV
ncbi:UNVERIFIED_CONTAM: ATPase 6, plasma membrane-type, partial [Sesamum calycinum]